MTVRLFFHTSSLLSFSVCHCPFFFPSALHHVVFSRWVYMCFTSHQNSFPSYGVRVWNPLLVSMLICWQPCLHNSPSVPKTMGKSANNGGKQTRVLLWKSRTTVWTQLPLVPSSLWPCILISIFILKNCARQQSVHPSWGMLNAVCQAGRCI